MPAPLALGWEAGDLAWTCGRLPLSVALYGPCGRAHLVVLLPILVEG